MRKEQFIGIDIGGTKISVGLVNGRGNIFAYKKSAVPKRGTPAKILLFLNELIKDMLSENHITADSITGIGIGVPGLVDPVSGKIILTPNMKLAGLNLKKEIYKIFKVPVAIGNDVNLGILGEKWLGAAKDASNIVGIFLGTGIGGGIIINNELFTGSKNAAGEIGHIIIDKKGPRCSCGNRGCLEAFAGRWAIERNIRSALKKGEDSVITKLVGRNFKIIKSKYLKKALKKRDPLIVKIMDGVSEAIGKACVSLRHIFDPDLIVLGGGVIEACGDFMLPTIEKIVYSDKLFAKDKKFRIKRSLLEDDAIVLGAVALIKESLNNT